ncbi:MAG: DUF4810 domain-containing protein, partial [Serratia symbiotica]|nr:DUF4810 domain-containing protein [Serratia symbiotica]
MRQKYDTKKIAGVLCTAALLAGCAAPKKLYNWDGYQTSIYQYYQQDGLSPEQQIMTLKEIVEKSRARDQVREAVRQHHFKSVLEQSGCKSDGLPIKRNSLVK